VTCPYEAIRISLVEQIVRLRAWNEPYAKAVMDGYLAIPDFPWPDLAKEVTAAWKAHLASAQAKPTLKG
jgi:hypothetical protein